MQERALRPKGAPPGPYGHVDDDGAGRDALRLERSGAQTTPPMSPFPHRGATSDNWTDWHWYTTVVNTNCREIIDNVVDMAHFFYIHGSLPTHFKNIFEDHVATQYMKSGARPDLGDPEGVKLIGTTSLASYHGPSFMIDDLTYHYEGTDQRTVLINCHYPIDANSFVLQYGIVVEKSEFLPEDLAIQTAVALGDFVKMGFEQDVAIWRSKARIDNPCWSKRTGRCISCVAGTSSSTWTSPTSRRTWWTASSSSWTPPVRARRG